MKTRFLIITTILGSILLNVSSCHKEPVVVKDGYRVTLTFKASPVLSQSLTSRFRISLFTDGVQNSVTDIASVKTITEGFSFNVVRGNEYELCATYGWPYGSEWYKNGSLTLPSGEMMPQAYGCYINKPFPTDIEAATPVGLTFEKLYYEFPVMVTGNSDSQYVFTFECNVDGFSWPELEPLAGQYHCEVKIFGTGHAIMRIPIIEDSSIMDITLCEYDKDGNLINGPIRTMTTGEDVSGRTGKQYSVSYSI